MSSEDDGAAGAPGAGGPAGGQPIMKEVSWGRVRHQLPSHYYTPSRPYLDFFEQLSQPGAGRSAVHFKSSVGLGRVGLMTFGMGLVAGFHLLLIGISYYFGSAAMLQWGLYVVALMAFHLMEFVTTARWNPRTTTADSLLLNHSFEYVAAIGASVVEFWLEYLLMPWLKGWWVVLYLGLAVAVAGQGIRTVAMWTAGSNFNHIVQNTKARDHRLVTDGIYQYLRHPSYFGWFWWSVSTQVLLNNPLCTCLFAWASFKFFDFRVRYEEYTLLQHFPDEYPGYMRRSFIGIPGVKGYTGNGEAPPED